MNSKVVKMRNYSACRAPPPRISAAFYNHTNKFNRNSSPCIRDIVASAHDNSESRRKIAVQLPLLLGLLSSIPGEAHALGFKKELKKRRIPLEEYSELPNGLKFYDLSRGSGKPVAEGNRVIVHFDCIYKGIDVVSSRSARLLGGNRIIAEPFEFIAGQPISVKKVQVVESAGGLFSGQGGPKPPPALSTAVLGMQVGGTRSVIVTPELGYGDVGEQEIGPGETFELKIELLSIVAA